MTSQPSDITDAAPAVANGLPPVWAALFVWLSSLLTSLLAATFQMPPEMPIATRVDLVVTWIFMSGLPVATTVWCILTGLQVRLSLWRLLALCILFFLVDALGQSSLAFLLPHGLVFLVDQGYTFSALSAAMSIVRPVATILVSAIVAWSLVKVLTRPARPRAPYRLAASCDVWAGGISLVFGFIVCLNWVDAQLSFIDWVDFFPPGMAALAKVMAAAIYATPIVWAIKSLLNPIPRFFWVLAAPYAAIASCVGLFVSSWLIAQAWGTEAQTQHLLLGFALAMLLTLGACYLPLRVIRPWLSSEASAIEGRHTSK